MIQHDYILYDYFYLGGEKAMYLNMLDIEKKHLFLDLEIYMSKIDGDFSEAEKQIIDAHCIEMHIDNNNYSTELDQDNLLGKLQDDLSFQERRIFFFELMATVLADDVYHDAEKELIHKLAVILNISEREIKETFSIVVDIKAVYKRCADFISAN